MGGEIIQITDSLNRQLCSLRRTLTVVESELFSECYLASDIQEKEKADTLIKEHDSDGLRRWIRDHPTMSLKAMSIRQLRAIARRIGLPYYSRLSSLDLAQAIEKYNRSKKK